MLALGCFLILQPFIAAVHVMGGAPGTRETDLLAPDRLVDQVDARFLGNCRPSSLAQLLHALLSATTCA